ncbi:GAF domain-containing protein [Romeria aff. gracilis LEGE 07310]|uniref:Circadian input-output histidine kinase CikA n=1 Tax=Vasconcelosia minhoensis LEGE 07310 TaxID=915328 RepID=A0A8J7ABH0_9CYAN|nr:ATP-binding protein [Romeria gracilis]MBE9076574.1 GAF domain-containing protein [Romeria aff. gracilis LEGE 07310]
MVLLRLRPARIAARLDPRRSLRARVGLIVVLIMLVTSLLASLVVSYTATARIEQQVGQRLAQLAYQVSDKLDRGIFERYREVQILSTLDVIRDPMIPVGQKRSLLNTLQNSYSSYSRISLTNPQGEVIASTDRQLEGQSVSHRRWFQAAKSDLFIGDVQEALLAKAVSDPSPESLEPESLQIVDIAAPVTTATGEFSGVLSTHLSREWAKSVRDSLSRPLNAQMDVEILILNSTGKLLIGPSGWQDQTVRLESVSAAADTHDGYRVETWPNGEQYLSGFARSDGYLSYPGLGWLTLVCQPTDLALSPVYQVRRQIWLQGGLLGGLFAIAGWFVAGYLTRPLLQIATAADRLRQDQTEASLPLIRGRDEVAGLSQSLKILVDALIEKRQALKFSNQQLEAELEQRQRAEAALQANGDRLQLLYETTRDLLFSDRPLTLISSLFQKLEGSMDLAVYLNYVLVEDEQVLRLISATGISAEQEAALQQLGLGESISGTAAQQRCQVVWSDIQNSDHPIMAQMRSLGMAACACQPLIAHGRLYGTLSFGSRSRIGFNPVETDLMQVLCDQIAIALERSELMASLQRQTDRLQAANRVKDEFLTVLSHELRTPLNPILGWTSILQKKTLSSDKRDQGLQIIERNVRHQTQLIDDLLDVAKIARGQLSLQLKSVMLLEPVLAAIETTRLAAEAKSIRLEQVLDPSVGPVKGDPDRLQQIVWNLLTNAIKFTPEEGQITLRLEQKDDLGQIQVTDTGKGISPHFLPHLFELFRQHDSSITRQHGGTGLGLTLVQQLVEAHGGTVTAASPGEGMGATFTVQLPLALSAVRDR